MPNPTYRAILRDLQQAQTAKYRSDPEANEAILDRLTESVVFILQKLADGEDAIAVQQD